MMKGQSYRTPKQRGLTAAQQQAHDKAYAACDHTIEGRHSKGDVVADRQGVTWKVTTYGIAYHEDVSSRIYGVQPCRAPKGWPETCELRQAIEHVRREGVQAIHSRGAGREGAIRQDRPDTPALASWQDGRAGSLASSPELTVYEGGIVGVYCPIYDDSPVIAWVDDPKFARRLLKTIGACPGPVHLPEVSVRDRRTVIDITPDHPRYTGYAAGRDAKPTPSGLDLPRAEWRRIKAELDAAGVPTSAGTPIGPPEEMNRG